MIRFHENTINNEIVWSDNTHIGELIIESPSFLRKVIRNISNDLDTSNYFTEDGAQLKAKHIDFIFNPFRLDFNNKKALTTLLKLLVKRSVSEENYENTNIFRASVIRYLDKLIDAENFNFEVESDEDFSIDTIAKAVNLHIVGDQDNFVELLTDYMDMMSDLSDIKLFIFQNLRQFLEDEELKSLEKGLTNRQLNILLIENNTRPKIANSMRIIIDKDMCEI